MIIDLQKFVQKEEGHWRELEDYLNRLEKEPGYRLDLMGFQRFHYLYRRTCADLAKVSTYATEREIRGYLEKLISRAYGEIHETRETRHRFQPIHWFFVTFPMAVRRNGRCFAFSWILTLVSMMIGGTWVAIDPAVKEVVLPFSHVVGDPSERVHEEEQVKKFDPLAGNKAQFSTYLMTHNIQVAILGFTMGVTWGIGTLITVFYNGLILGVIVVDYVLAGEMTFLLGWLLPHGVIEIPAFLISEQAGFMIAFALIGWRSRKTLRERFREISGDLVTLMGGVTLMLVWAGIIESFFSQYHEPVIPYVIKIAFGCVELGFLIWFLGWSGTAKLKPKAGGTD